MGDIDKYDLVGADESEEIEIIPVSEVDRNQYNPKSLQQVKAWTKFTFPNRGGQYSDFIYDSRVMSGISWELIIPKQSKNNIYLMNNHVWSKLVDNEYGNFDYLLGLNLDYSNPEMKSEAKKWGGWFTKTLQLDGYRLDAVKHIDSDFMRWWLKSMRNLNPNAFAVGEYWHGDLAKLEDYENKVDWSMSLFDVPLHFNFYNASKMSSPI